MQDLSFILPLPIIRILGLSCTQIGLFAYSENCQLRISSEKIAALSEQYDLLVALNGNDIGEYQPLLKSTGLILYNENAIPSLRAHKWYDPKRTYIPIALDSFAKIWGTVDILRPFVALGALAALIDLDIESLFYYLPTDTNTLKTVYQDCITAGLGYIRGLDQKSDYRIKPISYDSSRLYISGFDAICLALRKVDQATIAAPQPQHNTFGQLLMTSCSHYGIQIQEGSPAIIASFNLFESLKGAYSNHVLLIHHHDETTLFAATLAKDSYIVSDIAALYSHLYLAMLKQQLEHVGTIIFVADHVLMGYQTLHELPIPSELMYAPYIAMGSERARICILGTGSSKGVITETQALLKELDISTRYLHFNHIREMQSWVENISTKCELILVTTPLTINQLPALTTTHHSIDEWHDAQHLSQTIREIVHDVD